MEPLTGYTITAADVAGPFVPSIPADLVQQATLSALTYTSALEALAERFHSTPALLQQLNPGAEFKEGEQIQVPNVEPLIAPVEKPEPSPEALAAAEKERAARPAGTTGRRGAPPAKQPNTVAMRPDVTVTVSKAASALTVADASGRTIFYAPVTTGSEHDPLPIGEWKVNGRPVQSGVQLQPRPVLGRRSVARQGEAAVRAEQPGRSGVDRSQQGALRHPRHAGTVDDRPHRSRTAASG